MRCLTKLLWIAVLAYALPAAAVIIDSGDGTGNTSAPADDPGWAHVAIVDGSNTAVHLKNGWMITADHIGPGTVTLGGSDYEPVPDTEVQLGNGTADLTMFWVMPDPGLPPLPIASGPLPLATPLVMAGHGRNRGPASGTGCVAPFGYDWGSGRTLRWGTNHHEVTFPSQVNATWAFGSIFEVGQPDHEAQAANGDSGGAAFAKIGGSWELVGVMIARSTCNAMNEPKALYGDTTISADLWEYRDEILDVIAMPEPAGGLAAGALLLAALARRRARVAGC